VDGGVGRGACRIFNISAAPSQGFQPGRFRGLPIRIIQFRARRGILKRMLAHAKDLVAEGEARLVAQEARVAELECKGKGKDREGRESWKLLRIMRDTQNLQIGHVRLLERELGGGGDSDQSVGDKQ
jgi:hypothetical protein